MIRRWDKMMIVLKKVKRNNDKEVKVWRNNVREGLKEIREGFGYLRMKGDHQTLTIYPKTPEEARSIKIVANNYAIPYIVHS
jgi:hypothetical protein